jgi:SPFH domain / Band 7 family
LQFKDRIIDPAMQEAIKASTAKFTAEELITRREMVRDEIKAQLTARLKDRNILVDEFNIVNFEFSKNFNDAIEAKVTAEQQALAAKNKLEQIKFEADQAIAEARGKAEAMTIESNALKSNPQILELRALEKWNGTLPQVTGGAVPHQLPKVVRTVQLSTVVFQATPHALVMANDYRLDGAVAELRKQGLVVTVHNPSNETFYIKAEGIFAGYVVTGTELLELKAQVT